MSDISRTAGVGPTIKLGGKTLTVSAKIMRHYGEISAEIIKRRGNPMDIIRQAKEVLSDSPELVQQFVERAFDEAIKWKHVTSTQLGEFLMTMDGVMFSLWLAVRDNDRATLTFDTVAQMYLDEFEMHMRNGTAAEWQSEIESSLSQADGDDELGNSTGSPATSAVAGQQAV